eukprot:COSAG01_NODE_978_length_12357_cov_10.838554_13_plen_41_part_00
MQVGSPWLTAERLRLLRLRLPELDCRPYEQALLVLPPSRL